MKKPKIKKRRGRPNRGTLLLISSLLIGSALIRAGSDAGQAFARSEEPHEVEKPEETVAAASCEQPPDVAAMLAAFRQREERLKSSEEKMRNRIQALAVADQEIERKMTALTAAEERLRETIALADTAAEDDISRLISVYENMKPKDAAALFEEMDPDFAAGFLGRMRPEAAAGIMAGLEPNTAYTISVVLAGRNASVPKN